MNTDVRTFFQSIGVGLDVMDTKNACHTFNVLNQEGRSVAAALLPSRVDMSDAAQQRA